MVCGDTFDSTEATVACKQLGYNAYHNYNHLSQLVFCILFTNVWNIFKNFFFCDIMQCIII